MGFFNADDERDFANFKGAHIDVLHPCLAENMEILQRCAGGGLRLAAEPVLDCDREAWEFKAETGFDFSACKGIALAASKSIVLSVKSMENMENKCGNPFESAAIGFFLENSLPLFFTGEKPVLDPWKCYFRAEGRGELLKAKILLAEQGKSIEDLAPASDIAKGSQNALAYIIGIHCERRPNIMTVRESIIPPRKPWHKSWMRSDENVLGMSGREFGHPEMFREACEEARFFAMRDYIRKHPIQDAIEEKKPAAEAERPALPRKNKKRQTLKQGG